MYPDMWMNFVSATAIIFILQYFIFV